MPDNQDRQPASTRVGCGERRLEMAAYGICQNTVCSLSDLNLSLDSFRRRVHAVVHTKAQSKTDSYPQVNDWESFHKFFQKGAICSACGKPLYLVTQPIEGIDAVED